MGTPLLSSPEQRSPHQPHQPARMSSGGRGEQEPRRHHSKEDDHKHRRKKGEKQVLDPKYAAYHQQQQSAYHYQLQQQQQQQQQRQRQASHQTYAASNSGFKSGHLEVNSLYSGDSGSIKVNAMNAPNDSTLQCGCENIECPFCNQMLSIQMSGGT